MNDWNSFEQRLRGWKPRPPDKRIRQRLFPSRSGPANRRAPVTLVQWLAPIAAVLLISLMVAEKPLHQSGLRMAASNQFQVIRVFTSEESLPRLADGSLFQRNSLPLATFQSTNRGRIISSNVSFGLFLTNGLER